MGDWEYSASSSEDLEASRELKETVSSVSSSTSYVFYILILPFKHVYIHSSLSQ